jgi:hypothetical protein
LWLKEIFRAKAQGATAFARSFFASLREKQRVRHEEILLHHDFFGPVLFGEYVRRAGPDHPWSKTKSEAKASYNTP